jgi:hypothetical protein
MPLLRRPHDHRRELRAQRRTAPRRRPQPASEPRRHDACHCLIAPPACRGTSFPASHRCRPAISQGTCYIVDQAKIVPSTAAAATNSPPRSSIHRKLRQPAHPLPKPPPRQIPIDGKPFAQPPRVPSWKAFGRRPSARADRSQWACRCCMCSRESGLPHGPPSAIDGATRTPPPRLARRRRGRHHGGGVRRLCHACRQPRHRRQERRGAARGIRRARHRDRGNASLETPALRALKHLAPLREEAAPPRRPMPGRGRGRPPRGATGPIITAEYSDSS